ncbi:MAG: DUF2442 domain-containing protein [Muribaculaceae bacterium]|nr:DUF2442 domain-containing protein [Muribaculaceae bacterium]
MNRTQIAKIWVTDSAIWIELNDGRRGKELFADYPRLRLANDNQRRNYRLSYFGIHWPEIDEDLSFEGFFHKV